MSKPMGISIDHLNRVIQYLNDHHGEFVTVLDAAADCGISRTSIHNALKKLSLDYGDKLVFKYGVMADKPMPRKIVKLTGTIPLFESNQVVLPIPARQVKNQRNEQTELLKEIRDLLKEWVGIWK